MRAAVMLTVAGLLAGCSGKKSDEKKEQSDRPGAAARPAAVSDADVALADDWAALYGEYASAMEGAAADCARAAAAVREVNERKADLIAKGKPRMAELRGDPEAAKWLDENLKPKLGAALDRMAPTLDRCRGDAAVSAALAEGAFERKADQPR